MSRITREPDQGWDIERPATFFEKACIYIGFGCAIIMFARFGVWFFGG